MRASKCQLLRSRDTNLFQHLHKVFPLIRKQLGGDTKKVVSSTLQYKLSRILLGVTSTSSSSDHKRDYLFSIHLTNQRQLIFLSCIFVRDESNFRGTLKTRRTSFSTTSFHKSQILVLSRVQLIEHAIIYFELSIKLFDEGFWHQN
mmetsp:Transcript_23721/g.47415  ORF Transcript_23721/g.47415 Transcript_23721/m.47415 type:complete len:146 (+) Transcript_23721:167-604(+)